MVGHLKNVRPTFAQKPNRITNVEFTTVSPTIAKPILCLHFLKFIILKDQNILKEQRQNKIVKPLKHKAFLTRLSLPSFFPYAVQFVKLLSL
jgi:hypothetical protein